MLMLIWMHAFALLLGTLLTCVQLEKKHHWPKKKETASLEAAFSGKHM